MTEKVERSMKDWQPIDVSDVDMAFGGRAMELLPAWNELPEVYRDMNKQRPSKTFVSVWFYNGLKKLDCEPREGVDSKKAIRHIRACLGSFEPKHEHKIAGTAFLIDQFFARIRTEDQTYEFQKEAT